MMKAKRGIFMPDKLKQKGPKKTKEEIEKLKTKLALHNKLSKVQLNLIKQWQLIFDSISDALVLIDENGIIVQCNKSMSQILGKPCLEIIGSFCWELIHNECKRDKNCLFYKMKETRGRVSEFMKINGGKYRVTLDPFLNEKGDILGTIHIFSKIIPKTKKVH